MNDFILERKLTSRPCQGQLAPALFRGMTEHVVVVGMGQLGALFSEGFLRTGRSVTPVLRGGDVRAVCEKAKPDAVLIATGEDDLDNVLGRLPPCARDRALLIQNELRPEKWQKHEIDPTICIVWFEKRKGKPPSAVLPTVLYGKHSALLDETLRVLELPHRIIDSREKLAHELVLKNLYILGLNLTGLRAGGVAKDLRSKHQELFRSVIAELLPIEKAALCETPSFSGARLDEARLLEDLDGAILADPEHTCSGRSAPRRLTRTLENAARFGIKTPILTQLAEETQ